MLIDVNEEEHPDDFAKVKKYSDARSCNKKCLIVVFLVLLGLTVFWAIHYVKYHNNDFKPPPGNTFIPTSDTYKKLVINDDDLTYAGQKLVSS